MWGPHDQVPPLSRSPLPLGPSGLSFWGVGGRSGGTCAVPGTAGHPLVTWSLSEGQGLRPPLRTGGWAPFTRNAPWAQCRGGPDPVPPPPARGGHNSRSFCSQAPLSTLFSRLGLPQFPESRELGTSPSWKLGSAGARGWGMWGGDKHVTCWGGQRGPSCDSSPDIPLLPRPHNPTFPGLEVGAVIFHPSPRLNCELGHLGPTLPSALALWHPCASVSPALPLCLPGLGAGSAGLGASRLSSHPHPLPCLLP